MFSKLSNVNYIPTPAEQVIIDACAQLRVAPEKVYAQLEQAQLAATRVSIKKDDAYLYFFFTYRSDLSTATQVIEALSTMRLYTLRQSSLKCSASILAQQLLVSIPLPYALGGYDSSAVPSLTPIPEAKTSKGPRIYTDLVEALKATKKKLKASTPMPTRSVTVKRSKRVMATDAGKFNFASMERPVGKMFS